MSDLILYDRMCSAIAECHRVDEVKSIRDKARALEVYAQQARNTEAERKACEVRLRAERRTGELLKELERVTPSAAGSRGGLAKAGKSNGGTGQTPYADALQSVGLSKQTAHRYQALANVPSETFEAALRDPEKPTTAGMLAKAEASRVVRVAGDAPRMPSDSLWIWGRARDLEREGYFDKSPEALLGPMTETMLADMRRILQLWAEFIAALNEAVHELA